MFRELIVTSNLFFTVHVVQFLIKMMEDLKFLFVLQKQLRFVVTVLQHSNENRKI